MIWALVMAAGTGSRMGLGHNKALAELSGVPIVCRSVAAFEGLVDGVLVVTGAADLAAMRALLPGVPVAEGGATRQQSVLCGLRALPETAEWVLVHDAARPLVPAEVIRRCIDSTRAHGSGVASVPVKDTIKQADANGLVRATLDRQTLRAAQTPQGFSRSALQRALETMEARGLTCTDDAAAMEAMGAPVHWVEGDERNIKLTTPADMALAKVLLGEKGGNAVRMGHGMDAHRLTEGRALVLCGVNIPYEKGLLGHSDADVAVHALMDALLGAAALGDIGRHFPDTDPAYRGISSIALLEKVVALIRRQGYAPCNVDVTIVAQRPKLAPYMPEMIARVAAALGLPEDCVSIKATTTEGMGFEGEGLGMSAHAVATIMGS
ncbi:MAG: 2-C-methyl-D-erythritol 4-phosphate cytidylyltransferase [Oscillospiraceae bacterium]|jgi:2-C-methyl-D-erythritol 4-phosphate cytidylyltransferase/2-C-methyl-D-erythritol 2,4-cyclodiphosphate synthase|nr:2-C-methyl-D-erythritol 4-phosphate cytidylyltransferase [Oscillospiraceae bacterium]